MKAVLTKNNNYILFKSILDKFLALILLFILIIIPVLPVIAILIKLESKGPIFYYQKRIGKNGDEFNMIKFRSMYVGSDKKMQEKINKGEIDALSFKDDLKSSYTKIGKFIRKTSIDEIPQLLNIINGDMAVIGPRPIQQFEIDSYKESYEGAVSNIAIRNSILPGLLCYWQVSPNKDTMDFDSRIKLDCKYTKDISFITDLKILIQGVKTVINNNNV